VLTIGKAVVLVALLVTMLLLLLKMAANGLPAAKH
jgi:hypothetical protein